MFILVVIIHVLVCLIIIGLVLLQAGKGADIGSAFGGSGSQAVFGSMGTPTVLGKITTGVAIVFMLTSFWLAILRRQAGATTIMPRHRAPAAARAAAPAPGGSPRRRPRPRAPRARRPPRRRRVDRSRRAGSRASRRSRRRSRWPPLVAVAAAVRGRTRAGRRGGRGERAARCRPTATRSSRPPSATSASLIPNITSDAPSHEVGDLIYDGLVTLDKDLQRRAGAWRSRGRSARTASTLTFKLRRDVKWHDGQPFTADDVRVHLGRP